jgi:hypothetical protein
MTKSILWVLLLACDSSFAARAAEQVVSVRWSQIPVALSGQTATVALQGATVEGHLIAVSPESMEMLIEKTSDAKRYAKGQTSLPRTDVTTIHAIRKRIRGRVWGTLAGFFGGGYAGAALAANKSMESAWPALLIPVGSVIGYYVGKRADIKRIRIEVLPD